MSDAKLDLGEFGGAFSEFLHLMNAVGRTRESALLVKIREHLGMDPNELPSTSAEFSTTDHPNLQLALDALLPEAEVVGVSTASPHVFMLGIGGLLSGQAMVGPVGLGPVQRTDVEVGDGRVVRCVSNAVLLAAHGGAPVVLVVSTSRGPFGASGVKLEGVSTRDGAVSALVADLRVAMREHNVYRGQVISLHSTDDRGCIVVRFHRLPSIPRDAVVLPDGVVERLESHTIGIARHASTLTAAGRQLKRGVLLHGPPGTGKTLTVNYLLGAMPGRTTVLLTGRSIGLVESAVAIARDLTPATVVMEDVDLAAAERTMPIGDSGVLFELLNQMEGLDEDADLLFLLTTNRADLIEPALAMRPGRVDLALEVPLPDETARGQLIGLYAGDVTLDRATEEDLVARTEGLTGAFIRELMRQAALRAALAGRAPNGDDVTSALDELLEDRSTLTRRLLGQGTDDASGQAAGAPAFPSMVHAFGALGIPVPSVGP